MTGVVAIGERDRVEGFGLVGVRVLVAEDDDAVRRAWAGLGDEVGVAMLTTAARAALTDADLPDVAPGVPLLVVLPP